jgi:tRNA pseudouridine55 synthase
VTRSQKTVNRNQKPAARHQEPETSDQLNGILVVNKPVDITSAKVVAFVKQKTKAKKVGHAGTLDPFAEGVLICCLNKATRLARFLLKGDKTYEAVLKLGEETDTQDSTGFVTAEADPDLLSAETVASEFNRFVGIIEQTPPVYSALKHKGVPLYKLARRGQPINKPPRRAHIHHIEIRAIDIPFVHFEVSCSAGTYVRTLCKDIGRSLNCGGHLYTLKRTQSSGFTLRQALTLSQIEQLALTGSISGQIVPMADALGQMPGIRADEALVNKVRNGHRLTIADMKVNREFFRNNAAAAFIKILDRNDDLVAVVAYNRPNSRFDYCCVLK